MAFEIENNHGQFDKADKAYSLRAFGEQIRNYDFLSV